MAETRLTLALSGGQAVLPDAGMIAVLGPPPGYDLRAFPKDRTVIVTRFRPAFDEAAAQGFAVAEALPEAVAATVLVVPRAKDLTRGSVAEAARAGGAIIVDGAKTDGVDTLYREVARRAEVSPAWSKAHGKVFTIAAGQSFEDWTRAPAANADGYLTAPGVFSADGIDRASALLADALPAKLGGRVADLGAGWGYLSARALQGRDEIRALHLVEADNAALDCARANVSDPRGQFHWADATEWAAPEPLDAIMTNPPFHTGRSADPALGVAFIRSAARNLAPRGQLFLVANRHLPYERSLMDEFATCVEIAGDKGFKVLHATRPRRK
ncbi:class I SAM-dependent methyltransferase [Poseidonocella sedimentorum]|uniref:16S rRNA m(2)G 1207 methyltransferase n=1 Tax=Poseidonocella sedimentorum TaxID=871652 RepID=A0A1I6DUJ7_9RHOB|nr:methyltransferase [Poseidonocella sedimentorum]SFR09011.1 16S rRNA m(2)G 1207 methyltransferase [Poseidonocella sedimentorum]